jgi:hypothetical protein
MDDPSKMMLIVRVSIAHDVAYNYFIINQILQK